MSDLMGLAITLAAAAVFAIFLAAETFTVLAHLGY
jgi:hypothetical protein